MGRRIRRYQIDPSRLVWMFRFSKHFEVTKGLPMCSQFRGFCHDPVSNALYMFVEHESFAEIPEGQPLEDADLEVTEFTPSCPV